jgi:hypothetical protein
LCQESYQNQPVNPAPTAANQPDLAQLCYNVRSSFDRIAIFAEQHDLSYSLAAFFVLVGSLNILPLNGGDLNLEPVSPARIARAARMEPKTVSRWCGQLAERGLLIRKRGAYSVERLTDWYVLAACMQTVPLAPLPGLTPPSPAVSPAAAAIAPEVWGDASAIASS